MLLLGGLIIGAGIYYVISSSNLIEDVGGNLITVVVLGIPALALQIAAYMWLVLGIICTLYAITICAIVLTRRRANQLMKFVGSYNDICRTLIFVTAGVAVLDLIAIIYAEDKTFTVVMLILMILTSVTALVSYSLNKKATPQFKEIFINRI